MVRSIPLTSDSGFIPHPLRSGALVLERSGVCVQINPPVDIAAIEAAKQKIRQVEQADAAGIWLPMDPVPGYEDRRWQLIDDNRPENPFRNERLPLDGTAYQESEEIE